MGFDSIYLYFLDLNLHNTQFFSSRARVTPLPQQMILVFFHNKYPLKINALIWGEKN